MEQLHVMLQGEGIGLQVLASVKLSGALATPCYCKQLWQLTKAPTLTFLLDSNSCPVLFT